ncbi:MULTISPECIES: efflux RND transporter periplasmic adaptor subunit [Butyricimonas]|uniref:efflux RND transporter periplasmic adaptor subunit n=1 Tax=Butyricimonas TaxID=574697 RepID=UPI00037F5BB5|nr:MULTISPECIES: efflux RND transporter periplasmic adaptor subunit [Butyricimonas]
MNKTVFSVLKWTFVPGLLLLAFSCRRATPGLDIAQLVKTAEVQKYEGECSTTYPGKIKAASDVQLAFRVAGPILRFNAEVGEYVRKGQVLAEIDPRDYKLQYDATKAEYEQVTGESDRVIELYHRNSVPVNDYDKAVAAKQRIAALYHAHLNALNDTKLKAPFDGYVQKKFFDAHEIVNTGTPVLSMINNDYYEVNIDIPSSDFIRRESFEEFYCEADVYPGVKIPLELLDMTQQANYNQLFRIRFRMKPESDLSLAAGMSVSVTIRFSPGQEGLAIVPISSLFQKEAQSYVWVYDTAKEVVNPHPVQVVELHKDGQVIVESDLSDGAVIVSAGTNSLKDGQKVRRLTPVSSSNVGKLL